MPEYCYQCEDCEHTFGVVAPMGNAANHPECPECGGDTYRDYRREGTYVAGPVKTIGSIANRNADRFSDDYKEHLRKQTYGR